MPGRYVFDGTPTERERRRLIALEQVFDSSSRRLLEEVGLGPGGSHLEVGAGAGGLVRWARQQVGPSGRVAALDVDTRFLEASLGSVVRGDVRRAPIAPDIFDVAHARYVLIHLGDPAGALKEMIRCTRPGGRVVLEEPDFTVARSHGGPARLRAAFEKVHGAIDAMFRGAGLDPGFGSRLRTLAEKLGLRVLGEEVDGPAVPGGHTLAAMMSQSADQLREKYLATGQVDEESLEGYRAFAADPACRAVYYATVRIVASRPHRRA